MVSTSSPSECHPSSASSPAPAADCSFYNTGKSSPISHSETPAPANRAPPPKGGGGGSSPGGSVLQAARLGNATLFPWFPQRLVTASSAATSVMP